MKRIALAGLVALIAVAASAALPPFRPGPTPDWPCNTRDWRWVQFEEDCDANGDGDYSASEICKSNCRANEAICWGKCPENDPGICHQNCTTVSINCQSNCGS